MAQLTFATYEKLLMYVTYKPGWRFTVRPAAADFAYLEVQAPVYDTATPARSMNISISYAFGLSDWVNRRTFYAFVRQCAKRTEEHEFNEWFRVDGSPWPSDDHSTF